MSLKILQQISYLLHLVYDLVQYKYELTAESTSLMINCLLIGKTMMGRTDTLMLLGLSLRKALGDLYGKSSQVPVISTYVMDVTLKILRHQRISLVLISCFFHYSGFVIYAFLYCLLQKIHSQYQYKHSDLYVIHGFQITSASPSGFRLKF